MKRNGLTKEEIQRVLRLVQFLESQNESLEFLQPVNYQELGLLDYPTIIKRPMDLSTVRSKATNYQYSFFDEVLKDLMLIWENCRTDNPPSSIIYHQAEAMERSMLRYCSQHGIYIDNPNKRSREPNADAVPYQDKLDLTEDLKALSPPQLLQVVDKIKSLCPVAVKDVSEDVLQLKVDAIDKDSFELVWDLARSFESE